MSLDSFIRGYLAAAIWAAPEEEDGTQLDAKAGVEDIAPEAMEKAREDCLRFYTMVQGILGERTDEQAGHDFLLTRNGHGCGFDDGDWPQYGETLAEYAEEFGEVTHYLGDDGLVYEM